jgi:hypothetical protein
VRGGSGNFKEISNALKTHAPAYKNRLEIDFLVAIEKHSLIYIDIHGFVLRAIEAIPMEKCENFQVVAP